MRPRQREEHRAALDRRLQHLQAELAGVLPPRPEPSHEPLARGERPDDAAAGDGGEAADRPPPGRHAAPRWVLGPAHLRVVAVLLVLALVATGWWLLRSRPEAAPTEVGLTRAATGPAATVEPAAKGEPADDVPTGAAPGRDEGGPQPRSGQGAGGQVVVHVAGKVRRPGLVRLPTGSRVVDALEAAGGARRGVVVRHVNLARELVDGEQVLVGLPGAASGPRTGGSTGAAGGSSTPVDLNTAGAAELETLPGVGPVTAGKILDWRAEHGRYSAVEELLEVDGIGEATLAELAPLVTV